MAAKKTTKTETADAPFDPRSSKFPSEVKDAVRGGHVDADILLNIPVWGWTGHGKTCAILSAIQYAEAGARGLGLSLVGNFSKLEAMEQRITAYDGLGLSSLARDTNNRLRPLLDGFIDRGEYPPGTDNPGQYVLELRGVSGRLGYVVLPDLRGGSFVEHDAQARAALGAAHSCIMVVDPNLIASSSSMGRRYKDAVQGQLYDCREASVAVAVMIAKSDGAATGAEIDTAETWLTMTLMQIDGLKFILERVSVAGLTSEEANLGTDTVPVLRPDRMPEEMVRAWVWALLRAYQEPRERSLAQVPQLRISNVKDPAGSAELETIAELREFGEFSEAPGDLLLSRSSADDGLSFIFLSDENELYEASLPPGGNRPSVRKCGRIAEKIEGEVQAREVSEHLLIGAKTKTNFIFSGRKGDVLARSDFALELTAWEPVSARHLIGLDTSGRLHSLVLEDGKWRQADSLPGFVDASDTMIVGFVRDRRTALASNGTTLSAVDVEQSGIFGRRRDAESRVSFNHEGGLINRIGMIVCPGKDDTLHLVLGELSFEVGGTDPEAKLTFVAAQDAPTVARFAPSGRLYAATIDENELFESAEKHSPELPEAPSSMAWTPDGTVLAVAYSSGNWALFKTMGL